MSGSSKPGLPNKFVSGGMFVLKVRVAGGLLVATLPHALVMMMV